MAWPSWDDYWDMYLAGGLLAVVILQLVHHKLTDRTPKRLTPEEATVTGLPFYTEPSYWRFLLAMPIFVFGSILVPAIFQGAPFWLRLLVYLPVYGLALLTLAGLGIKERQAAWERDDKLERQRTLAEAARQQQLTADQKQLENENARYAALNAGQSNSDITETARRVAEELKRS